MNTFYGSDTPNRAIIAKVIELASEVASTKGGYVGRTALQKILYFLQRVGVPLPYSFDLYHYGPFCADIYTDVDYLIAEEVIGDQSDKQRYSNYIPGGRLQELLERHTESLSQHSPAIKNVVEALVPLSPDHLELIATLDYLHQQETAKNPQGPVRQDVVRRFLAAKGVKFGDEAAVERVYSQLQAAGLFRP